MLRNACKTISLTARCIANMVMTGLIIGCILYILPVSAVHAAEAQQAIFSVKQTVVNDNPSQGTTFVYRLVSTTVNAPMPAGSGQEGFVFTITGTGEYEIGPIIFSDPGVFIYELRCIDNETDRLTVDRRKYNIEVHVMDDMQIYMFVYIYTGIKLPEISFEHIVNPIQTPEPEPTPTPAPTHTPSPTHTPGPGHTPSPTHTPDPGHTPTPTHTPIPTHPPGPGHTPSPTHNPGPGNTGNTGKPGNGPNSPQTGDLSNPLLWTALIALAGTALIIVIAVERKLKRRRGR